MFKRLLAALFALIAATAFAAVDINKANQAELESVKGIGPSIAGKMLDERKKSPFKDWSDMVSRVKGIGEGNATKFSTAGLTVNGQGYKSAAAPAKADDKATPSKADAKADETTGKKAAKKIEKEAEKAAKAEAAASATPAKK